MATMRCGSLLVDCAGRSVDRERRGYCVGDAVPGAVESDSGEAATGCDAAVVTLVFHRHVRATLGFNAVPEGRNCLPVGKGPGQRPTGPGGGSVVEDAESRSELARVLRRNRVVNRARGAGPRGNDGEGDGGGCGQAPGGSLDGDRGRSGGGRAAGREREHTGRGGGVGAVRNRYAARPD